MRHIVLSTIILSTLLSCNRGDILNKACPHECEYTGLEGTKDVGVCKAAKPTCDDDANIISCEGEVLPEYLDVCDGVDNNCNGLVDEYLNSAINRDAENCLKLGECALATPLCLDGRWHCNYGSTVEMPEETRCDGLDNDCDGEVDDDLFGTCQDFLTGDLGPCTCYSGPMTAINPPCSSGFVQCINGETICSGEVLPSYELCDNIDNDCNGFVDDTGDILSSRYDIVFNVDDSGSMCNKLSAVVGACSQYAEQFDGSFNHRFAIVRMTAGLPNYVTVDTDFTDFAMVRDRLVELSCTGAGYEAAIDSMLMVCDKDGETYPFLDDTSLTWDPNANGIMFVFTDEKPDSLAYPNDGGADVIDTCNNNEILPFIWSQHSDDYEYIAEGANGSHFYLIPEVDNIFDDMNSIIIKLCGS